MPAARTPRAGRGGRSRRRGWGAAGGDPPPAPDRRGLRSAGGGSASATPPEPARRARPAPRRVWACRPNKARWYTRCPQPFSKPNGLTPLSDPLLVGPQALLVRRSVGNDESARAQYLGPTGKRGAGKLARPVWSGGKAVRPYLSLLVQPAAAAFDPGVMSRQPRTRRLTRR